MLREEQDEDLNTPFQLVVSGAFYLILLSVGYLMATSFVDPPEEEQKPKVDRALIAQCQSYDDNPWVREVGWRVPVQSFNECPTVVSRFVAFADQLKNICYDSYVTARISPIVNFVKDRNLKTGKAVFETLYYWPNALTAASIGQDTYIKMVRCAMLSAVSALPVSESAQEKYQRLVLLAFHVRAARSLRRRLTQGLAATGVWRQMQTTAIAASMEKRGNALVEAFEDIDGLQEYEINNLMHEVKMNAADQKTFRLAELRAQTLRFKLASYLTEIRSDLSHAQDAWFCMQENGELEDSERESYRDMMAALLIKQCSVSRQLVDVWDFYHNELPARRRAALWSFTHPVEQHAAAAPTDGTWLSSLF